MVLPIPPAQLVLDLVGVFVFALSGGLLGVRRQLDVFGVLVLAAVTGLGGGLVRDVLIGAVPPSGLRDGRYLVVAVGAGLIAFLAHRSIERIASAVQVFDAAGLGLFTVGGAVKAQSYGLGPVASAVLGLITGIGGGIARDLLVGRVPVVLRTELYAVPALVGAAVVVAATCYDHYSPAVAALAAGLVFVLRMLAVWRGWNAPVRTVPRPDELP